MFFYNKELFAKAEAPFEAARVRALDAGSAPPIARAGPDPWRREMPGPRCLRTSAGAGCPAGAGVVNQAPGAHLVADALMMAVWRRGKPLALLHHSDQGSQYTSGHFQDLLKEQGIRCSMSRAGEVWDNSAMESFFSSMKTERTARKVYRSREQARADVFDYIECFYNPTRRHSTLGYLSPRQFEKAQQA